MSALESIEDKHELVREYADIEDAFEPFEQKVEKAVTDLDRHLSLQDDITRGKQEKEAARPEPVSVQQAVARGACEEEVLVPLLP